MYEWIHELVRMSEWVKNEWRKYLHLMVILLHSIHILPFVWWRYFFLLAFLFLLNCSSRKEKCFPVTMSTQLTDSTRCLTDPWSTVDQLHIYSLCLFLDFPTSSVSGKSHDPDSQKLPQELTQIQRGINFLCGRIWAVGQEKGWSLQLILPPKDFFHAPYCLGREAQKCPHDQRDTPS